MGTKVQVGDVVDFEGAQFLVARVNSIFSVELAAMADGERLTLTMPELWAGLAESVRSLGVPGAGLVDLEDTAPGSVGALIGHLDEIWKGRSPDHADYDAELDPRRTSEAERATRKATVLSSAGWSGVSQHSLLRKVSRYKKFGPDALVDGRSTRGSRPLDRADPRTLNALSRVIETEVDQSLGTVARSVHRAKVILNRTYPDLQLPSDRTLIRYYNELVNRRPARATSARTRANSPKRLQSFSRVTRPGERVEIDSTPMDIMVQGLDGAEYRAALTVMVDVATGCILGHSLNPVAAKGTDHSIMLLNAMLPRPVRPGREADALLRSAVLPAEMMIRLDASLRGAAARPLIVPESITMDGGMDFRSAAFESTCRRFGISLIYGAPRTPTHKPHIERLFHTLKTELFQYLPGFTGGSPVDRGVNVRGCLDILVVDEIVENYITSVYHQTPRAGLTDPLRPRHRATPNQMYAQLADFAGLGVPVPISDEDYTRCLKLQWRDIGRTGVTVDGRQYDDAALNDYRDRSGPGPKNQWEVRCNPYDPASIWVHVPDRGYVQCKLRALAYLSRPGAYEANSGLSRVPRTSRSERSATVAELIAGTVSHRAAVQQLRTSPATELRSANASREAVDEAPQKPSVVRKALRLANPYEGL